MDDNDWQTWLEEEEPAAEDHLFDYDDALDYILYEHLTRESSRKNNTSGCLGIFMLLLLPITAVIYWGVNG